MVPHSIRVPAHSRRIRVSQRYFLGLYRMCTAPQFLAVPYMLIPAI
jgi:hypothetical protein